MWMMGMFFVRVVFSRRDGRENRRSDWTGMSLGHLALCLASMASMAGHASALPSLANLASSLIDQAPSMPGLPNWSDYFTSLKPYRTAEEEELYGLEEESARLGFIQLNTGTTSFNTTLNLTGHLLLGLGLASALLFWIFLNAFNKDDYGSEYGYSSGGSDHSDGYGGRRKRDLNDLYSLDVAEFVPPLLARMEEKLRLLGLIEADCWTLVSCEASRPEGGGGGAVFEFGSMGDAIRGMHGLIDEFLSRGNAAIPGDPILRRHLHAMTLGRQGKDCKADYPKCNAKYQDVLNALTV